MSSLRLANKVIVIIGGTSGLGLSAAQRCIAEGARVVVVGRDASKAASTEQQFGSKGTTLVGDATDPGTATRAIELAVEKYGALHGLYHVAGGSGRARGDGPLDQVSDEGWGFTLRANLDSLFFSNRAALRHFLQAGQAGSIVNMTSVLATSPAPRFFATHGYATTKAAAIGLTQAAASYYATRNIRFNAIAPALVDTPLAQRAKNDQSIMTYVQTKQPLDGGRIGVPQDTDGAVVFFLSDESRFVTGQVLAVDGGWCLSEGQYPVDPSSVGESSAGESSAGESGAERKTT